MAPAPETRETAVQWRQRLLQALGIGLVATLLALGLWTAGLLERWEARFFDAQASTFAKPGKATDQICLIFLDQDCLDLGKQRGWSWPWPRQVYGAVLDFCRRSGAKAVAFDVIFSEPDINGADQDFELGRAIAANRHFVGSLFVGSETGGRTNWPGVIPPPSWRLCLEPGADRNAFLLPKAAFPVIEIATNAAVLATVYGNPDPDGIYRRLRPFSLFDGQFVPSLGLGSLFCSMSTTSVILKPRSLEVDQTHKPIPLDKSGCAILNYRGRSQTHHTVNIISIIDSELAIMEGKTPILDPQLFKDKYVFIGFTAPGLFDLRSSPIANVYPGVEIHATFLDNLLSGDFIREAPVWLTLLLTMLLSCLGALGVRIGRQAWQNVAVMVLFIPIPILLGLLAYSQGVWLPVMVQLTAIAPALTATLALNYLIEGRQKRFIKGAFKQYLSPVVIEELMQHPERLKLGGELRELSIFFSDIRGFTSISEHLHPEELTTLLNDYLTAMTDIIYRHGGTVDKYEGDAIIAFWNAPLPQQDHAQQAVITALECQAKLEELNPSFKARIGAELNQRIGLNSGQVVVGNMGSRQRFNYTFLGDAGNLAARLEGINKQFGTSLLISENTRKQLDVRISTREIARVQVIGRKEPVRVFEPMMPAFAAAHHKVLDSFAQGLAKYYEGSLQEALNHFASIEAQDAPAEAYARRCRTLLTTPPPEWNGVWVMTEK